MVEMGEPGEDHTPAAMFYKVHLAYLSSDSFFAGQTRKFRLFVPLTRYFLVTRRVMK